MKWYFKYVAQRGLSLLPFDLGVALNTKMQRKWGNLRRPHMYGIGRAFSLVQAMNAVGVDIRGKRLAELGTGWDAAAGMALLALGSERVISFDLRRHLDLDLVDLALSLLQQSDGYYDDAPFWRDDKVLDLARGLRPNADLLDRLDYHAPSDARHTNLADESVDLYFSLAVLEHVPREALMDLFTEARRIVRDGGHMYHYIQPTMHAAVFDRNATGIEYLRVRDVLWRALFANKISYENRMRAPEYLRLIEQSGFKIVKVWKTVDEASRKRLSQVRLAPMFREFSTEENATDYIWVVAQKR